MDMLDILDMVLRVLPVSMLPMYQSHAHMERGKLRLSLSMDTDTLVMPHTLLLLFLVVMFIPVWLEFVLTTLESKFLARQSVGMFHKEVT